MGKIYDWLNSSSDFTNPINILLILFAFYLIYINWKRYSEYFLNLFKKSKKKK